MRGRICTAVLVAIAIAISTAGSSALTGATAQTVGDRSGARHQHAHGHRHYAVMGDSITAGSGTSDWTYDASGAYVRVSHLWGYGEQAGLRTFAVGSSCVAGDWCGYGADGSDQVALRWLSTMMLGLKRRPTTVITHIGINDLVMGLTAEQIVAGLLELRRQQKASGTRVVFGTVGPSPATNRTWAVTQTERLRLNDWIRNTQRTYVDYARSLEGADGWLRPEFESSFHDVHVNDAGAAAMAAAGRFWVRRDLKARAR